MKHIKPPLQEPHTIRCYALPPGNDRKAMRRDFDAIKRILDLEDALSWAIRQLKQSNRVMHVEYLEKTLNKNKI